MSEDVVPVEEYDELSKLVDKLLTEKAQLQLAVEKQADQLKVITVYFCWLAVFALDDRDCLNGVVNLQTIIGVD